MRALLALALAAGACQNDVPLLDESSRAMTRDALAALPTKAALSDFSALAPAICVPSSTTAELCEWRLAVGGPGWSVLARTTGSSDGINLLCELPLDGSSREPDSCSAHPRRSNRELWKSAASVDPGSKGSLRERKRRNRLEADRQIEEARTLVALSRLVGAVCDPCTPIRPGFQRCTWSTTSQTYGHGTLATAIEAPYRKKVRLRCELPNEGGDRWDRSCEIEVWPSLASERSRPLPSRR